MALEQEWLPQVAEKYCLLEEQKEESNYLHRSQLCDLFFYVYFIIHFVHVKKTQTMSTGFCMFLEKVNEK